MLGTACRPVRTGHHRGVGKSRSASDIVTLASMGQELRNSARMPRLIAIDGRAGAGKS